MSEVEETATTDMIKCPLCKTKLDRDAVICSGCGAEKGGRAFDEKIAEINVANKEMKSYFVVLSLLMIPVGIVSFGTAPLVGIPCMWLLYRKIKRKQEETIRLRDEAEMNGTWTAKKDITGF